MEDSQSSIVNHGAIRRAKEEREFEAAAFANRGKIAANAEAYGPDAKPIGEFEISRDDGQRPPKDAYLGDKVEALMQPEDLSISGGGSKSSRRKSADKKGHPTESDKRQAQVRSDQEYEMLRPRVIAGRVSEEAYEALHSDPKRSPGVLMEALGRALLGGLAFEDVLARLA